MREEDSPSVRFRTTSPFSKKVQQQPDNATSILLEQIQDQQIYLCLSSTLLRLAKEAGAPEEALKEVAHSMLTRRGYQSSNMMTLCKSLDEQQKRHQSYEWLDRGSTLQDQKAMLSSLQRMVVESREKQDHYRCLVKYRTEKSEEIAPTTNGNPNSKKQRFKRMLKQRNSRITMESSDFYKFQVNEVLQNSFKYENQCYRTIASFSHLKTMFGHASQPDIDAYSQIFNGVFDRSENLIITGGEEGMIKVWHRSSGSLISNLKGHSDYLNKIDTSRCNKYIMSSAGDGIRFFELASLRPLGGWKTSSIAQISSFLHEGKNYFLFGDNSYLYVLTEEVMLANTERRLSPSDFYKFYYGDVTGRDSTSILVISTAPQKKLLLLGIENGQLLMVAIEHLLSAIYANQPGDELVLPCFEPVKAHSQDIIEIKWSQRDDLWATGGKDGRCCLWELNNDRMHLITSLSVSTKGQRGRRKKQSYSCTYICWNCVYSHFAAGFQQNVEEEDSDRGRGEVLVYSLKQRRVTCQLSRNVSRKYGGIRAMDSHPYFPNILLIGESDGHILFLDIYLGCIVNTFEERGFHLLHPQFQLIPSECHFTKDGLSFIVATEYGSISLYGYDSKCFYTGTPVQQFLLTDFQQFTLQQDTMKAIPLTLSSSEDINLFPKGQLLNIRAQRHPHAININPQMLLRALSNPVPVQQHIPEVAVDQRFMTVIHDSCKQLQNHQQIYTKALEEIEGSRCLVLFHERERQYLIVSNLINEKIKMLQSQGVARDEAEIVPQEQDIIVPQHPRRTRKPQRNPERQAISYVDDFDYHDSQEEDYNAEDSFLEQDIPQELEDDFSQEEDEDGGRKRRIHKVPRRQTRRTQRQLRNNLTLEEDEQPEVATRRRRRDIIDEPHEFESEVPRKKQKIEEDSSEHKGYSRLKKQIDESKQLCQVQGSGECYRCQISRATVFCSVCPYSQQFCIQCSKMRGKRQRQRYECLICIYLKNSTHEEHQNVSQDNYRAVKLNQQFYLPQLQDKVRFFFQGYQEFLVQNVNRLNPGAYHENQAFRLLPHSEDNSLTNTPVCQVISIQYYFPVRWQLASQSKRNPGKGENAAIQMLVGLKTDNEQGFWVFYWPGLQFLLKQEIYSQIESKNLISKLSINELVSAKNQEMQIVELAPFEDVFPETIWKNIKVRKTDGKRLRCNTKEIEKQVNIWKISTEIVQPEHPPLLDPFQEQQLQSQLEQLIKDDSPFSIFNDYVDFDIYPEYRQHVPVGMCLQTILKRLQNKYYTSQLSLREDINLIKTNSLKFNGPNHVVTQNAAKLCEMLHEFIPRHSGSSIEAKNNKEQSTTKKEKKPKQSEEQLSFVAQDEVVTKKKDDHQYQSRRRRRQSSEFQEDSFSPQNFSIGVSTRRTKTRNGQPKELRRVTRSAALR